MRGSGYLPAPTDLPVGAEIPVHVALPHEDPNVEPRIVEYWRTVLRNWRIVAACTAVVAIATGAYVLMRTPLYTAESKILIERRTPQVLDVREIVGESLGGEESNYYRTQQEILQSRALAVDVIRQLGLDRRPEFTGADDGGGLVSSALAKVRAKTVGLFQHAKPSPPGDGSGVPPASATSPRAAPRSSSWPTTRPSTTGSRTCRAACPTSDASSR